MGRTLGELARSVDGEVVGDAERQIERVRPLEHAEAGDLSFLTSPRYVAAARASRAGALLVGRWAPPLATDRLVVDDPARAVAILVELFHPRQRPPAGIHPTAVLGTGAVVEPTATVGPFAVLGRDVRVAAGAVVSAHVVLGDGVEVGEKTWLHPHVVVYSGTKIAAAVEIHAGAVLGADGFGYSSGSDGHRKIPQVGGLEIGPDVEIGALTAIDRGALDDTRIGAGTKIDNLVQVGHNVQVGEKALLCGQAGVAGSARLGSGVVLAGQAGVADHVEIGDGTQVAAKSAVLQDLAPGLRVAGIPAIELREWKRRRVIEGRLGEIWRRVRGLGSGSEPGSGVVETDGNGGTDGNDAGEGE